jgi:hypothetical protein
MRQQPELFFSRAENSGFYLLSKKKKQETIDFRFLFAYSAER